MSADGSFPPPLDSYQDAHLPGILEVLGHRVAAQPFNLWATLLFLGAVVHSFFTHKFRHWAHRIEERHRSRGAEAGGSVSGAPAAARVLHFLGEVEAVFGIWVLPLAVCMGVMQGTGATIDYLNHRVNYQEPLFVVVIMAVSSTRPILSLAERFLRQAAGLLGGGVAAWWFSILTLGPLLGSLITEPAAMTISAFLLAPQFYTRRPRASLAYATLGLLFVNVSIGGTLTHFAAPPVLMVARPWGWDSGFMFLHFGWKAVVAILASNGLYWLLFRRQFIDLETRDRSASATAESAPGTPVPAWVTAGHLLFMGIAVLAAHTPALLIGSLLFFLAFFEVTQDYQGELPLRSPILVGFFLAGLVIHGGLQQWWIAPVLGSLGDLSLMFGAIGLTAFNDNAAITYLSTLVPGLSETAQYAVVAGAVVGGGLTVIANAPNPAGQSILGRHFPDGIAPLYLLLGALLPTVVAALAFLLL